MTKEIHLLTTDLPTEVLNLLTEDQIILGAVASTINERYKRMINFSVPISIQPYSFIVSKPKAISRIYLFTAPFTAGVSRVSVEICKNPLNSLFLDLALPGRSDCHSAADSVCRQSAESILRVPWKDEKVGTVQDRQLLLVHLRSAFATRRSLSALRGLWSNHHRLVVADRHRPSHDLLRKLGRLLDFPENRISDPNDSKSSGPRLGQVGHARRNLSRRLHQGHRLGKIPKTLSWC